MGAVACASSENYHLRRMKLSSGLEIRQELLNGGARASPHYRKKSCYSISKQIEDRLQNDAQTVVNFLSDGAVVDAIMSIERKNQQQDDEEDEDPTIRKIDVTNPPSKKRDQPVSALVR